MPMLKTEWPVVADGIDKLKRVNGNVPGRQSMAGVPSTGSFQSRVDARQIVTWSTTERLGSQTAHLRILEVLFAP